jgi:hypothetical protein
MMTGILCKLLPLYKFAIYYNEDEPNNNYEYVLVSDTINGLIESVVNRELIHTMKNCRKYLTVEDFLFMPYAEISKGYCLYDIFEHDVAEVYGLNITEQFYECSFVGKEPVPVVGYEKATEYLMKMLHKPEENEMEQRFNRIINDEVLAEALYQSAEVQTMINDKKNAQILQECVEIEYGEKALEILKFCGGEK